MGKLTKVAAAWAAPALVRPRLRTWARRVWDAVWNGWRAPEITAADYHSAVHVLPGYGERPHKATGPCWCLPRLEDYRRAGGRLLIIHRDSN